MLNFQERLDLEQESCWQSRSSTNTLRYLSRSNKKWEESECSSKLFLNSFPPLVRVLSLVVTPSNLLHNIIDSKRSLASRLFSSLVSIFLVDAGDTGENVALLGSYGGGLG